MMTLVLGYNADLTAKRTNRPAAYIIFLIRNNDAVDEFMANQQQLDFLTAPINGQDSGCNLHIEVGVEEDGDRVLLIRRIMGPNSIPQAACMDLLSSLKTYIIPGGSTIADPENPEYDEWVRVSSGLTPMQAPVPPEQIPTKNLARGVAFLGNENINPNHNQPHR